jgi:hypothetical protein
MASCAQRCSFPASVAAVLADAPAPGWEAVARGRDGRSPYRVQSDSTNLAWARNFNKRLAPRPARPLAVLPLPRLPDAVMSVVRGLEVGVARIRTAELATVHPGTTTNSPCGQFAPGLDLPNPAVAIGAVQFAPPPCSPRFCAVSLFAGHGFNLPGV